MLGILFRKDNLVRRYTPVDIQLRVIPQDASFALWSIIIVTLILEQHLIAQYGKAVGKSMGDEKLSMVLACQFHGHVLSVGRGAFP